MSRTLTPQEERMKQVGFSAVQLQTREGRFVETVMVPPMNPPPDALLWGERFFARHDDTCYREIFCCHVVEPWKAPEQDEKKDA